MLSTTRIYFFVPNIIGYVRIGLTLAAFQCMLTHPWKCMVYYMASCLLDALDGTAARRLNQCRHTGELLVETGLLHAATGTRFGAVLDMVTDRSTTAGLLVVLSRLYPSLSVLFQCLIGLDLSSHYMQMYASLLSGSDSHKKVDPKTHALLRCYYGSRTVLFWVCAGDQITLICLYLLAFRNTPHFVWLPKGSTMGLRAFLLLSLPVCFFKQTTNVIGLAAASQRLVAWDAAEQQKRR